MEKIPDETIQKVWEKAIIVPDYDKDQARHDSCGKLIYKDAYGVIDSDYGWVISHSQQESDEANEVYMKPLHWKNDLVANNPVLLGNCDC